MIFHNTCMNCEHQQHDMTIWVEDNKIQTHFNVKLHIHTFIPSIQSLQILAIGYGTCQIEQ